MGRASPAIRRVFSAAHPDTRTNTMQFRPFVGYLQQNISDHSFKLTHELIEMLERQAFAPIIAK
jgi:hypothetical protein